MNATVTPIHAVTIEARVQDFTDAMARIATATGAVRRLAERFRRMSQTHHAANQVLKDLVNLKHLNLETAQAGMEARWYVRGGLDPAYASEAARDAAVKVLANNQQAYHPEDLAASFLRGWVEHRDTQTAQPTQSWHRHLGRTQIIVTRGGTP